MKSNTLRPLTLSALFAGIAATLPAAKEKEKPMPGPIVEIGGLRPSADVFGAWDKPTRIATEEEAAKVFEGEALAKLKEKVDFEKQIVLVFAWRGSGQDKLNHVVLESFPEQVRFSIERGRTRDLRPHVHVFALRSNVDWAAGGRR